MAQPRTDVVNRLVDGMMNGMEQVIEGSTANEVASAAFTLALRMTKALWVHPENHETVRQAIGMLLLECAETGRAN